MTVLFVFQSIPEPTEAKMAFSVSLSTEGNHSERVTFWFPLSPGFLWKTIGFLAKMLSRVIRAVRQRDITKKQGLTTENAGFFLKKGERIQSHPVVLTSVVF